MTVRKSASVFRSEAGADFCRSQSDRDEETAASISPALDRRHRDKNGEIGKKHGQW